MGLIDDVMASDAAFFTDADMMPGCESVLYTYADGLQETVNAQVFRDPPEAIEGFAEQRVPNLSIWRARAGRVITPGVDKVELTTHGDSEATSEHIVTRIVSEDSAGVMLALSH